MTQTETRQWKERKCEKHHVPYHHKYVRVGKFSREYDRYALVDGIVFGSIYQAEDYCTLYGVDPNACIDADDDRVLLRCQQIAHTVLPTLRFLRDELIARHEILGSKRDTKRNELRQANAERKIGRSVYNDYYKEAFGKVEGCRECITIISRYIYMLECVTRLQKKSSIEDFLQQLHAQWEIDKAEIFEQRKGD